MTANVTDTPNTDMVADGTCGGAGGRSAVFLAMATLPVPNGYRLRQLLPESRDDVFDGLFRARMSPNDPQSLSREIGIAAVPCDCFRTVDYVHSEREFWHPSLHH